MSGVYALYGLAVGCDRALPAPSIRRPAQVRLEAATTPERLRMGIHRRSKDWFTCHRLEDGALALHWTGIASFLVSNTGAEIRYHLESEEWSETFLHHLFVQALSFSLLARGRESLHGTAIQIGGEALALVGRPGAGKSTLAAALLREGGRVVCDDLVAFDGLKTATIVHAGLPHLKLLPRSAFLMPKSLLGNLLPGTRKKIFRAERSPSLRHVPLGAIYLLGGRSRAIKIEPLSSTDALVELLAHPFNCVVNEQWRWRLQLESISRLVQRVPVFRLRYPRSLDAIHELARAVASDFAERKGTRKD